MSALGQKTSQVTMNFIFETPQNREFPKTDSVAAGGDEVQAHINSADATSPHGEL